MKNYLVPLLAAAVSLAACDRPEQRVSAELSADVVYTNGRIYTVNEAEPWAEAVAIKDGVFLIVGSTDEAAAVTGENTEVIDLAGRFVMPGLHDTHLHLESFYTSPMLEGKMLTLPHEEESLDELQRLVAEFAAANPDQEVLFGEGLRTELFPNVSPTREFLDEVVPDRPIIILSASEHETLHNTAALQMAGITAETTAPEGGEIVIDPDSGEPTGFLKETAAGRWGWKHYPQLTREQHAEGLTALQAYLNSIGLTSVKTQHAKDPVATAISDLDKAGALSMRVGLSWTYKGPLEPMPLEAQETMIAERRQYASDLVGTEFIKLSMDGTAGTTGLMVEPYEDGSNGIAFYELDDLGDDIARLDAMGLGITVHASGDGAVRLFLDGLQAAKDKNGALQARHQIGHAHFVHPDDLDRIVQLNASVEHSPAMWFQTGLTDALGVNIGAERMQHAMPAVSITAAGARVAFASDGPLMWQEPLHSMESAVTRRVPEGEGGQLAPEEGVDLATAIRGYTINGAYLMNQEDKTGSIEVGKRADMVVLDQNLFDIDAGEISDTQVLLTIFNGRVVYDAADDPSNETEIEEAYEVEIDLTSEDGRNNLEVY